MEIFWRLSGITFMYILEYIVYFFMWKSDNIVHSLGCRDGMKNLWAQQCESKAPTMMTHQYSLPFMKALTCIAMTFMRAPAGQQVLHRWELNLDPWLSEGRGVVTPVLKYFHVCATPCLPCRIQQTPLRTADVSLPAQASVRCQHSSLHWPS